MFSLITFLVFGLVIGLIAKAIHPGEDPVGFLPTLGIGIAGSYIGGGINWLIGRGDVLEPSGIFLSIIGGVIFCWAWRKYSLSKNK